MRTLSERRRRMARLKTACVVALAAVVFSPKVELANVSLPFVSVAEAAPIETKILSRVDEPMRLGGHSDKSADNKEHGNH